MSSSTEITALLVQLKQGKDEGYKKIYPLIYQELRQLAHSQMTEQSFNHTLSKTELVHETYLK